MLDYLFYKLYRLGQKSSDPSFAPLIANMFIALLLLLNLIVVYGLLEKIGILTVSKLEDKEASYIVYACMITISIILAIYFFFDGRHRRIIAKYENEKNKFLGSLLVFSYVIVTIAMFFVATYIRS